MDPTHLNPPDPPARDEIRIGVSTCLMGEPVRYDGGHKHDRFLTDHLGDLVRYVAVCPEVEVGMGTPRESVHLIRGEEGELRMVGSRSGTDHTARMNEWAARRVRELEARDLSGYVLKSRSPSCGMERVKIHTNGMPEKKGRGLFAAALMDAMPWLPVEEEGRLNDPRLRESFFERVFAYRRLRNLLDSDWETRDLVAFHTREKLFIRAHDEALYRELGRLVADPGSCTRDELGRRYGDTFMRALGRKATRGTNVNVLHHIMGYFKDRLEADAKQELLEVIEDYRAGIAPLLVPLTLVRHHVRRFDVAYLASQSYLNPHPKELMLRSYVI